MYVRTYVRTYVRMHMYMYMYMYNVCVCVCVCVCAWDIYIYNRILARRTLKIPTHHPAALGTCLSLYQNLFAMIHLNPHGG